MEQHCPSSRCPLPPPPPPAPACQVQAVRGQGRQERPEVDGRARTGAEQQRQRRQGLCGRGRVSAHHPCRLICSWLPVGVRGCTVHASSWPRWRPISVLALLLLHFSTPSPPAIPHPLAPGTTRSSSSTWASAARCCWARSTLASARSSRGGPVEKSGCGWPSLGCGWRSAPPWAPASAAWHLGLLRRLVPAGAEARHAGAGWAGQTQLRRHMCRILLQGAPVLGFGV